MATGLEVVSHPTGLWLVRAGAVIYAVPAELGRPLEVWRGQRPTLAELNAGELPIDTDPEQWSAFMASLSAALSGGGSASGHRLPPPIWLRVPLLPAAVVRRAAGRLSPLTSGHGLLACLLMGLAGYGHLAVAAAANPIRLAPEAVGPALALFLVTAVWHELGHAAALAHHGYPPGGIGAGMLFVIPVLFADVSAIGLLSRRGRVRVDVSGVAFQFGLGGLLAAVGLAAGGPALLIAAWLALVAVCWSLFPFIRADGYWLMCDLLGVTELEVDPDPAPRGMRRWLLGLYRLANAVFLLGVGFLLPVRYAHRGVDLLARCGVDAGRPVIMVPLLLLAGGALGIVWWNILRRVARLVRAVFAR